MPEAVPRITMQELVERFVADGQQLLLGGFAFSDPTAFAHELIRQERRNLEVLKTSGGLVVDLLCGGGCIDRLAFCHVWNSVGPEPAHGFRRAVEQGQPQPVTVEELSYGAFTMGLAAAAWGLPFMPTTPMTLAGHDMVRRMWPDKIATVTSPFGHGEFVSVVKPIAPELGVFHVQRVDEYGNGQMFGPTAEFRQSIGACERVVLIAEELVPTEVVRERPELTVVPGFMVEAVVIEPWAAHPTDSAGYYARDLQHHAEYGRMSRTSEGFEAYVDRWIRGTENHGEVRELLGDDVLRGLAKREDWW
jgi:glutaconate CoA-transferase, subunit A